MRAASVELGLKFNTLHFGTEGRQAGLTGILPFIHRALHPSFLTSVQNGSDALWIENWAYFSFVLGVIVRIKIPTTLLGFQ
jgi:hypothetical protein